MKAQDITTGKGLTATNAAWMAAIAAAVAAVWVLTRESAPSPVAAPPVRESVSKVARLAEARPALDVGMGEADAKQCFGAIQEYARRAAAARLKRMSLAGVSTLGEAAAAGAEYQDGLAAEREAEKEAARLVETVAEDDERAERYGWSGKLNLFLVRARAAVSAVDNAEKMVRVGRGLDEALGAGRGNEDKMRQRLMEDWDKLLTYGYRAKFEDEVKRAAEETRRKLEEETRAK